MSNDNLKVVYQKTDKLVPYARNARTHSDEQIEQIAASMREFGFTNPVLVDADNGIIAGHGRILAAQQLGIDEVPTIKLGHLTEAKKRAYIIADNKLALNAGWDEELLKLEIEDLQLDGFDINLIGFSSEELDAIINGLDDDEDHEEIEASSDESQPGVTSIKLKFGDNEIDISQNELELLESKLNQYVDAYGSTFGFVEWLVYGSVGV